MPQGKARLLAYEHRASGPRRPPAVIKCNMYSIIKTLRRSTKCLLFQYIPCSDHLVSQTEQAGVQKILCICYTPYKFNNQRKNSVRSCHSWRRGGPLPPTLLEEDHHDYIVRWLNASSFISRCWFFFLYISGCNYHWFTMPLLIYGMASTLIVYTI